MNKDKKSHSLNFERLRRQFSRAKEYASQYDRQTPLAHFFNTRLRRVGELIEDFEAGRVLDVGCGPARVAERFRGLRVDYHGVDISGEMIEECNERFAEDRRFHFHLGKMENLPFPNLHFDLILCLGAFEYVEDANLGIQELLRVLKPDGSLLITMHNPTSPYRLWLRYGFDKLIINGLSRTRRALSKVKRTPQTQTADLDSPYFRVFRESKLRHLLTEKGLLVKDAVYYDFNLFLPPLDALFPRASVVVSRKLEFLCRSSLKQLGTGYILKAAKMRT